MNIKKLKKETLKLIKLVEDQIPKSMIPSDRVDEQLLKLWANARLQPNELRLKIYTNLRRIYKYEKIKEVIEDEKKVQRRNNT